MMCVGSPAHECSGGVSDQRENTPTNITFASDDVDGDVLSALVEELPSLGTLSDADGNALAVGDVVAFEDVRYQAAADECGLSYDSFTYRVVDNGTPPQTSEGTATVDFDVYCEPGLHVIAEVVIFVLAAIGIVLLLVVFVRRFPSSLCAADWYRL